MSSPTSPGGARGRPVEIDPDRLERVAIALFEEKGYDVVSAAEIAEASGVSRRSLFRYFPSKANLVWGRFAETADVLSSALASKRGHDDPRGAARAALAETADHLPDVQLARRRMRIIGTNPELIAFGTGQLHEQSVLILSFLLDHDVEELEARVLGDALSLSSFNGYLHWALRDGEEQPRVWVERALAVLQG